MKKNLTIIFFILSVWTNFAFAQEPTPSEPLSQEKIIAKAMPTMVVVLTGKGDGTFDKLGSGIVVSNDGVIFTAYHVVKDATQVQIRFKNGEIYDKVDLVGFDERRDVAALKITATNLPSAIISQEDTQTGGKVFVLSNPQGLNWSVSDGMLSSMRLADEIPNAGRGFRVLQFSAPVSAGSSGGLLLNDKGQAIGLIVSTLYSGQNLNFAIPMQSVSGLINSSKVLVSFEKGKSLELPYVVRPPVAAEVVNADPKSILKNAKILYIASSSSTIKEQTMARELMKNSEFEKWQLVIVEKYDIADLIIHVEHQLFTWDYIYKVTDRRTNITLLTGKVTAWDGNVAAGKFAKIIMGKLKEVREPKEEKKKKDESKKQYSDSN